MVSLQLGYMLPKIRCSFALQYLSVTDLRRNQSTALPSNIFAHMNTKGGLVVIKVKITGIRDTFCGGDVVTDDFRKPRAHRK